MQSLKLGWVLVPKREHRNDQNESAEKTQFLVHIEKNIILKECFYTVRNKLPYSLRSQGDKTLQDTVLQHTLIQITCVLYTQLVIEAHKTYPQKVFTQFHKYYHSSLCKRLVRKNNFGVNVIIVLQFRRSDLVLKNMN